MTTTTVLVWKISWTGAWWKPQSMGSQRVNTTEQLSTQTHKHTHRKGGLIFEKLTKEKMELKETYLDSTTAETILCRFM